MSDSVDRVFVHALATVRRLPRTGSSRPPPSSRLRLYGLYKQSMEGDVLAILPRPTLPVSSPDMTSSVTTTNTNTNNNSAVHRYASRDVRTREAHAEIEKWDAWHACAGMSRTEAKRQYISTLIETMKEYASGTVESRELVGELEFVWSQIRGQSGSGSDPDQERDEGGPEGEKSAGSGGRGQGGKRPSLRSVGTGGPSNSGNLERSGQSRREEQQTQPQPQSQKSQLSTRPRRTPSGLRVLSPVSRRTSSSSIYSPIEPSPNADVDLPSNHTSSIPSPPPGDNDNPTLTSLTTLLNTHIHTLRTELAALREQLSANHLLSSSTYTLGHHYYSLTRRQRLLHRAKLYIGVITGWLVRQMLVQIGIVGVAVLVGRWKGDRRGEMVVRGLVRWVWGWMGRWFWVLFDGLARVGRMVGLGRWMGGT